MTLIDDLSENVSDRELARRKLLGLFGSGALAAAMGGTVIAAIQYISPNVLYEEGSRVRVGRPEAIPPGTVLVLPRHKIYVIRSDEGFFAISAICTHLGCMTRWEAADRSIFCPCHGSRFAADGTVQGGPAPRPLPRLEMTLEGGQIYVNARKPASDGAVLRV